MLHFKQPTEKLDYVCHKLFQALIRIRLHSQPAAWMDSICSRCKQAATEPLVLALSFDNICQSCADLTSDHPAVWTSLKPVRVTSFEHKRGLVRRKIKRFRTVKGKPSLLYPEFEPQILREDRTELQDEEDVESETGADREESGDEPDIEVLRGGRTEEYLPTPRLSLSRSQLSDDRSETSMDSSDPIQPSERTETAVTRQEEGRKDNAMSSRKEERKNILKNMERALNDRENIFDKLLKEKEMVARLREKDEKLQDKVSQLESKVGQYESWASQCPYPQDRFHGQHE